MERTGMRKLAGLILLTVFSSALGRVPHRLGITAGFPQMGAVAYQYTPVDHLTLEAYLGTLVINFTGGGRLILSRTEPGFSPRAFTGIAVVDQWYGDNPDSPTGTAGYLWYGVGLGYNFPCGPTVFADLGWIRGGNPDKGLGYEGDMAISGGLLFGI